MAARVGRVVGRVFVQSIAERDSSDVSVMTRVGHATVHASARDPGCWRDRKAPASTPSTSGGATVKKR